MMNVLLLLLLLLLLPCSSSSSSSSSSLSLSSSSSSSPGHHVPWVTSAHLSEWFQPFDLCLLHHGEETTSTTSTTNTNGSISQSLSIQEMTKYCQSQSQSQSQLAPVRCRVGNTWPSHSEYCDPTDIPFYKRSNLLKVLQPLDNPRRLVLQEFFYELAKENGLLLMMGDSVMQQFFSAMACELEREQVWKDPSLFTNTDESRTVRFEGLSTVATAKFLPVYHLVNGRYDRVANAAMNSVKSSIIEAVKAHRYIIVMINMGLHYIDNPAKGFTKNDYHDQVTTILSYLQSVTIEYPQHQIQIVWRETTAQHFATPNGYWPGSKFSASLQLGCVPLQDTSPKADWRNRIVEDVILKNNLFNVKILRFYNLTIPLWSEHPNGQLRDCTHFCWSPLMYQPIFHYLNDMIVRKEKH